MHEIPLGVVNTVYVIDVYIYIVSILTKAVLFFSKKNLKFKIDGFYLYEIF